MRTQESNLENPNSEIEAGDTVVRQATGPAGPARCTYFARATASDGSRIASFDLRISIFAVFAALLHISCAAPAEPQPRHPPIPERITDLAAVQRGDSAVLTFTLPAKTRDGNRLRATPTVEILRAFGPAGAKAPLPAGLAVVETLPGPVLEAYLEAGRVEFYSAIPPEDIVHHAGAPVFYAVRCRVSKRAASEDSNAASFIARPAPAPIAEVHTQVTEAGVQLTWEPPVTVSGGAPLAPSAGFRVFRTETAATAASGSRTGRPVLLGASPGPSYLDSQIEWGKTYSYTVRTVAQFGGETVESSDSPETQVTPKDIFPPAPPTDLVVVFVPAGGTTPAAVELSWSISMEPDAAGYYVYRTGEDQANPQRVTPALLPTPAFRDISLMPGARYTYTVTAVDRSGNESRPGTPVSVAIPKAGE